MIFIDIPTHGYENYLLHIFHQNLFSKFSLGRKLFDDNARIRPFYPNPDGLRIFKHLLSGTTSLISSVAISNDSSVLVEGDLITLPLGLLVTL